MPEKTRFHNLCYMCATLFLSKNINFKIVSEKLGHTNIATALDTYSYLLLDMQKKAACALDKAMR